MASYPGLSAEQNRVASAMIGEVQRRKLPPRAAVILIETGIVESGLRILANPNVPSSLSIPHDGIGYDHASVGPLQQQVPMWGTARDCMDPATSAGKFLQRLVSFNWQSYSTGGAAQHVQVSAFPDRYQAQESLATKVVNVLWSNPVATTQEDPLIIVAAPNSGIAQLVPGGKYHLAPAEWDAINAVRLANPSTVTWVGITDVQWNYLAEKRGRL